MINQGQIIVILFLLLIITIIFIFIDDINDIYVGALKKRRLNWKIKRFCRNNDFLFLSRIVLPAHGFEYHYDQIIIANKFIYVITNRIWLGDLTGIAIDEKWLLYQGKKLIHVPNPLKASEESIEVLISYLKCQRDDIINLVLLAKTINLDEIRTVFNQKVIGEKEVFKWIKSNEKTREDNFTKEAIENCGNDILNYHMRYQRIKEKDGSN